MSVKKKKVTAMPRVNTRITEAQRKFIKAWAKKKNKTEGEIFREIIDFYIYEQ